MDVSRFDVKALTVGELDTLIEMAEAEREIKKDEERKRLLEEWEKIASDVGLTVEEVVGGLGGRRGRGGLGGKRTRAKAEPKYANPANKSDTWSGRGRKPKWVETALKGGKKIEELLIKKARQVNGG